jgi:HEAT repeat protein
LAAFAEAGLELADAYLAAEAVPRAQEYFHHVLSTLAQIPLKAIPGLIEAIRHTDGEVPRWAARAFWPEGWKETWIAPLVALLESTDRDLRFWAVESLGAIGDTQAIWITFSEQECNEHRASGFAGARAKEVGDALLGVMLHDPEERLRSAALYAIERIGVQGPAAAAALAQVVHMSNLKEKRNAAIRALASMGPQAQGASLLLKLLIDPDGQVPWRVLEAISSKPDWIPRVVSVLTAALKDGKKKIRSRAVAMMMRLGPEATRLALPVLREALLDEDDHVRSKAKEAIQLVEGRESGS